MSNLRRMKRSLTPVAVGAGATAALAGLLLASPAGAAGVATATDSGDVAVTNRESVEVELSPEGEIDAARIYSQLTMIGKGTAAVADPSSGKGVRDLDGFSPPSTRDGKAFYEVQVDGREDRRTVADYDRDLPVTLKASYTLDGKPIDAEDVVGKSGLLEATYVVRNTTATPTEITYKDGNGKEITETVPLVTPYAGRLALDLPSAFSSIAAERAEVAGDGHGGTLVSWSFVLFNPLGEPAQKVGWAAQVTDAKLPPATLQLVPITPSGNQILSSSQTAIEQGATSASALTAGVGKVDAKLIELRAGTTKLLDGLVKLSEGANALTDGLAGTAAPGARQLAEGMGKAKDGGGQLATGLGTLADGSDTLAEGLMTAKTGSAKLAEGATRLGGGLGSAKQGSAALADGLGKLDAGAGQLSTGLGSASAGSVKLKDGSTALATGAGAASDGATKLADGLTLISGGLEQLAGTTALPAAKAGAEQLRAGVDKLLAGLGSRSQSGTILNGLAQVEGGLGNLQGGLGQISTGLQGAQTSVGATRTDLEGKLAPGGELPRLVGAAESVRAGIASLCTGAETAAAGGAGQSFAIAMDAACKPQSAANPGLRLATAGVAGGTVTVRNNTQTSYDNLGLLHTGLGQAIFGLGTASGGAAQLQSGAQRLLAGVDQVVAGLKSGDPAKPGLAEGLDRLVSGLTAAVGGVMQLSTGAKAASTGADQLAAGNKALAEGAAKLNAEGATPLSEGLSKLYLGSQTLSAGTKSAAEGAGKLDAGLGQLSTGGGQAVAGVIALDAGLTKLADGGGKLAAGADKAAAGAGALDSGLGQLLTGSVKLADGLEAAGEGSGKLADGINQVKDGVTQVDSGAGRLSAEGTALIAGSANTGATDASKRAAMLQAVADKAADGALPYGAPEGGSGTAAYSLTLAGVTGEADGNAARGGAALALLALASASGFFVRRRFAG